MNDAKHLAAAYRSFLYIAIAFLLMSCFEQLNLPAKISVKISVSKTPLSAPFFIAEALNLFENTCADVTLIETIGGKKSFDKVMNGEADYGTSSDSVLVFESLTRDDFVTLATFAQSDNDVKIITTTSSGIITGKDTFNKRIGYTKGAAGEYLLSTFLALEGSNISHIISKQYAPDKLQQALLNNEIDVVVLWEPYAYQTIKALSQQAKVLNTKSLYKLTFNLIALKTRSAEQVDSSICILKGLNRAINYIAVEPDKSKAILVERLALDQQFIDGVWEDYIFKLGLNRSLQMSLQSQATWAIENGMVAPQTIPNYEEIIDASALLQVNPLAVTLL